MIYGLWSLLTVFSATGVHGAAQDSTDSGRMSYHMEDLTSALDTTLQENDEVTLFILACISHRRCMKAIHSRYIATSWPNTSLHGMNVCIHLFYSLRVRR